MIRLFLLIIFTFVHADSNVQSFEAQKCCLGDQDAVNSYTKKCTAINSDINYESSLIKIGNEIVSVTWRQKRGFPNCSSAEFPSLRVQLDKFSLVELRNGTFGLFDAFGGIRTHFCMDFGVDEEGRRLDGTAVVGFCEASQKETCHERPCFSLCCPEGYYKDGETCR